MPDIKGIQDQIVARLSELQQLIEPLRLEAEQLTRMAAALDGEGGGFVRPAAVSSAATYARTAPRANRAAGAASGAKRGRPMGSGNRAQQAVAKIIEQPGITVAELAKSMGISPNYLYRVLPRLEREAKVIKRGRGYHPSGDAKATAPSNGQPVAA